VNRRQVLTTQFGPVNVSYGGGLRRRAAMGATDHDASFDCRAMNGGFCRNLLFAPREPVRQLRALVAVVRGHR
jgi:hypothetical protein